MRHVYRPFQPGAEVDPGAPLFLGDQAWWLQARGQVSALQGDIAHAVRGRFLYSGGIGRREDLVALAQLRQVNLAGVIVGKALYEQRFTIAEGQAALDTA